MSKLTFNRKPMPIYAEYRPLYKIAQIVFVLLLCSRGSKSSLIRLQLFNWALKDVARHQVLIEASSNGKLDINVWGMDPSLNSAIQFAIAEGIIERNNNGVSLTEYGKKYTNSLLSDEGFEELTIVLSEIGKGITESMITMVSDSWG